MSSPWWKPMIAEEVWLCPCVAWRPLLEREDYWEVILWPSHHLILLQGFVNIQVRCQVRTDQHHTCGCDFVCPYKCMCCQRRVKRTCGNSLRRLRVSGCGQISLEPPWGWTYSAVTPNQSPDSKNGKAEEKQVWQATLWKLQQLPDSWLPPCRSHNLILHTNWQ